jgi:hypothetical protein
MNANVDDVNKRLLLSRKTALISPKVLLPKARTNAKTQTSETATSEEINVM